MPVEAPPIGSVMSFFAFYEACPSGMLRFSQEKALIVGFMVGWGAFLGLSLFLCLSRGCHPCFKSCCPRCCLRCCAPRHGARTSTKQSGARRARNRRRRSKLIPSRAGRSRKSKNSGEYVRVNVSASGQMLSGADYATLPPSAYDIGGDDYADENDSQDAYEDVFGDDAGSSSAPHQHHYTDLSTRRARGYGRSRMHKRGARARTGRGSGQPLVDMSKFDQFALNEDDSDFDTESVEELRRRARETRTRTSANAPWGEQRPPLHSNTPLGSGAAIATTFKKRGPQQYASVPVKLKPSGANPGESTPSQVEVDSDDAAALVSTESKRDDASSSLLTPENATTLATNAVLLMRTDRQQYTQANVESP